MQWEYRTVVVSAVDQKILNYHGNDGFELVMMTPPSKIRDTDQTAVMLIFKKPKK